MAEASAISWTDSTFNPWIGCTRVSPACDHCYAETLARRTAGPAWGPGEPRRRTKPANWSQPKLWNRRPFVACTCCPWRGELRAWHENAGNCPGCGRGEVCDTMLSTRRRVFCASLADVFDNEIDPAWRADLFELILATPNLDWLLLTKRIGNARAMIDQAMFDRPIPAGATSVDDVFGPAWPWANVWLGATVVTQAEVDRDVPKLLETPAAVRFLSIEPLLGPITFVDRWEAHANPAYHVNQLQALDWIIVGGESGAGARPMHPEWVRELRDQAEACETPFHFKQWGEWVPVGQVDPTRPDGREVLATARHVFDDGCQAVRIGKKHAGRQLDGRTHDDFPDPDTLRVF